MQGLELANHIARATGGQASVTELGTMLFWGGSATVVPVGLTSLHSYSFGKDGSGVGVDYCDTAARLTRLSSSCTYN